jgi:hypothetical protein
MDESDYQPFQAAITNPFNSHYQSFQVESFNTIFKQPLAILSTAWMAVVRSSKVMNKTQSPTGGSW